MDRNDLINKFIQIETLAFKGRHLVEVMATQQMADICRHIRRDLEDLEIEFGRRVNGATGTKRDAEKT